MEFLDSIDVRGAQPKRIELYRGDLADIPKPDAFDLLVVSAFPDDYTPTARSLIGALARKGLSVASLAANKEVDLRTAYGSWLSEAFTAVEPGMRFHRILCFEPLTRGAPPEVVGDIFRALTPILAERPEIRSIALPVVASGDQGYGMAEMLSPLLDAALHWLEHGLPLERIKVVVQTSEDTNLARDVFARAKGDYADPAPPDAPGRTDYDVFISYSRANTDECDAFERALVDARQGIRIFLDRNDLAVGSAWQQKIFESLDRCRKVVALLSPQYAVSKVCQEEFNIAWYRARETDSEILFPIYLYDADELPSYMKYRGFVDCREGDRSKLAGASASLLTALDA
jgi:hypothetical protein